jgi:hypothetical protein
MGPAAQGFTLAFDAASFDGRWVLLPGVGLLLGCAMLLLLGGRLWRGRAGPRLLVRLGAAFLFLLSVWWTLGGVGAWRAGVGPLGNGTANFVEGTLAAPILSPAGAVVGFEVSGQAFHRAQHAFLPPLHASRWPSGPLHAGERVRVWFFGDDVLRLESAPP